MFLIKLCTLMENDRKIDFGFSMNKSCWFLNKNESNGKLLVTQLVMIVSLSVTNQTIN